MKTLLATAALLALAAPSAVEAQVVFGVGGGMRSSSLAFDPESDILQDSRTGFAFSGFVGIPLGETFRIQPGVGYGQRGAVESAGATEQTLALSYIEVPILGVFSPRMEGPIGSHFFAGPTLGFELACEVENGSDTQDCTDPEVDIGTKSFDVGLALGAAISYATSETMSLFLAGYYNLGLTNVDDDGGDDGSVKNRVYGFDVGLAFRRGG